MFKSYNFADSITHGRNCIQSMIDAYDFFVTNKLWKGYFNHGWIALFSIVISIIFTYSLFGDIAEFLFPPSSASEPLTEAGLNADLVSEENLKRGKTNAVSGGSKFLLLILLEIVIFFFSVKTIEILTGTKHELSFTTFWNAEVRMIKVMIRSFVLGLLAQIGVSIILSIFGFSSLSPIIMFLVYGYFMGFAFFDNYNELHNLNIKKSEEAVNKHFGASFVLGIVVSTLVLIPLIGPILTPIFGAITANMYGHQYNIQAVTVD